MFSINGITPAGMLASIYAPTAQAVDISADSGRMDSIQGTDVPLAVAQIAIKAQGDAENLDMARTRLMVDSVKESGSQVVSLLENLGQNVDLYA
jgi:hypothetical protein